MNWYDRHIFPFVLEWAMSRPDIARERPAVISRAVGDVLEIGFGTGLNLPLYPASIRSLSIVEPNDGLARRAQRRIDASGRAVRRVRLKPGNTLDAGGASFDTVVSTWTMCSIADLPEALREVRRVLRPGGRLLFIEHGLAPDASVARWQHRLNGVNRVIGAGCNLDRDIGSFLAAEPWRLTLDRYYLPRTPRVGGYTYRGEALKTEA